MNTQIIKVNPEKYDSDILKPAAECIKSGGLVALPTETVYGIACDADNEKAVARLLEVRKSPQDKFLTVHIADKKDVAKYYKRRFTNVARRLMSKFWPGPLTIIFPTDDVKGIGLRYPNNPIACDIIKMAGVKVVAPSANLAGEKPATNAKDIIKNFSGKLDFIIDGGETRHKTSSTVVKLAGFRATVLREGAIPKSVITEATGLTIIFVCTGNTCRSPIAEYMFKTMLAKKYSIGEDELEENGFVIYSAGTSAGFMGTALPDLCEVMGERGYDMKGHLSQPLTNSMVDEADYIFAATREHLDFIKEWATDAEGKLYLISPDGDDIADPMGGGRTIYQECMEKIEKCLKKRLNDF